MYFATTVVDAFSTAQTVTLSNTGNATLTGIAISSSGTNASAYLLTNSCTASTRLTPYSGVVRYGQVTRSKTTGSRPPLQARQGARRPVRRHSGHKL